MLEFFFQDINYKFVAYYNFLYSTHNVSINIKFLAKYLHMISQYELIFWVNIAILTYGHKVWIHNEKNFK
jgi:hypothetical protein